MVTAKDVKLVTVTVLTLVYFLVQIIMSRAKSLRNTFGWARIEVLGMLVSILFLAALYFSVVVEALQTIFHASHQDAMHHPIVILIIAAIGVLLNVVCFFLIGGYTHEQGCFLLVQGEDVKVNVVLRQDASSLKKLKLSTHKESHKGDPSRSLAYRCHLVLDFFRDVAGCLMVVASACTVYYFDADIAVYADPAFSIISVFILLSSSYPFVKQSGMILLQNIPDGINVDGLKTRLLQKFPEVLNVHDLHVWRFTRDKIIATLHIICLSPRDYKNIACLLDEFFQKEGITLTTIQPEFIQYDSGSPIQSTECILGCGNQESTCQAKQCCNQTQIMTQLMNKSNEDGVRQRFPMSVVEVPDDVDETLLETSAGEETEPTIETIENFQQVTEV